MKYNININIKPKKFQQDIISACFDDTIKRVVVCCARQLGKSYVMRYVIIKWMLERTVECAYISPTNKLNNEVFNKFARILPKNIIKKINGSSLEIELINNSRVTFLSGESIQNCRGLTLDYVIVDETAFIKEYAPGTKQHFWYNIVSPFLDAKSGKAVFISTPNGSQGFFYEQVNKAQSGSDGYAYVKCTIYDDETKTKEWIEEKKADLPSIAFQQEYECKFISDGISYFNDFEKLFVLEKFNENSNVWGGLDFSTTGGDDTVLTLINEENEVVQFYITGDLMNKYSEISRILNNYSDRLVCCNYEVNSIGQPMAYSIKQLLTPKIRDKFVPFVTTNTSKADGVHNLAWLIEQSNIHFMYNNTTLMEEFKIFVMTKSKTGLELFGNLPGSGRHDDGVLSLIFATEAKRLKGWTDRKGIMVIHRK